MNPGGSTSVENCQILQTRGTPLTVNYQNENSFYWKVNRLKKDAEGVSVEQLRQMSAPYPFTSKNIVFLFKRNDWMSILRECSGRTRSC